MERDWRTQALIVGAVAGALLGVLAARLYVNAVEQETARHGERPPFGAAQAAALGLAVLGVLRQISALPQTKAVKRSARKKR